MTLGWWAVPLTEVLRGTVYFEVIAILECILLSSSV